MGQESERTSQNFCVQALVILELVDLWLCSLVVRYASELRREADEAKEAFHKAHHFIIYIPSLFTRTPKWIDVEVSVQGPTG